MEQYLKPVDAEEQVRLVNIWSIPYKDVVDGKEIVLMPGIIYKTEKSYAMFLLLRAQERFEQARINAENERKEWARRVGSSNRAVADSAKLFCDEEGNPRTVVPENQGLICIDTQEGKKLYDLYVGDSKVEEPVRSLSSKLPKITTVEQTNSQVEAPDPNWSVDEKVAYVKRHSHRTNVNWYPSLKTKGHRAELERRVERTYQALKMLASATEASLEEPKASVEVPGE